MKAKQSKDFTALFIGDVHFPFHSPRALRMTIAAIKKHKPDYVVQIGDLFDLYTFSKYAGSVNAITPQQEIENARRQAVKMWADINKIVPRAKKYQLIGNHDIRPNRKIAEFIPEIADLFNIRHLWEFKGVTTMSSHRDVLVLDPEGRVAATHGYKGKRGSHIGDLVLANTKLAKKLELVVIGHLHRGGIDEKRINGRLVRELNCGWIGDKNSIAFSYTAVKRFVSATEGYGLVKNIKGELFSKFVEFT